MTIAEAYPSVTLKSATVDSNNDSPGERTDKLAIACQAAFHLAAILTAARR
ncbi:hypothetical protein ACFU98_35015 [Streptomyces sp. NPDC057575]|uniref:hypothetical protein n=1 Tax=unclassified Streptomyces TaxID=2593676 RepID=UPI0036B8F900